MSSAKEHSSVLPFLPSFPFHQHPHTALPTHIVPAPRAIAQKSLHIHTKTTVALKTAFIYFTFLQRIYLPSYIFSSLGQLAVLYS